MKITKFAALAGVALLAGAGAFAQATDDYNLPQGFYFNNEIGSDVVKVTGNAHKDYEDTNWRSEFMGIYDDITLGYTSEKLAFEISPRFGIRDDQESYYNGGDYGNYYGHGNSFLYAQYGQNADANGVLNSDDMAFSYWGFDWDFRFSPFDIVDFYLNAGPDIVGSKLFARDTVWGANWLGSDGFAIITKPIDGLRISGAIPFGFSVSSTPNYLNAEVEDSWIPAYTTGTSRTGQAGYKFQLDLGADYTLSSGLVGAGVKVNNVINAGERQYGVYAGLNMGALAANLGFNFSEDYTTFLDVFDDGLIYIGGKQAVAASASFVAGDLKVLADVMSNLKKKESVYDVYAGAKVAYDLVPGKFNVDMLLGVAMDLGTNAHHGTEEDDKALNFAATTINGNFIDLYYGHVALEDLRAVVSTDKDGEAVNNDGVAASQNWQYYTALARTMSNGNIDTTSAAKAALALRVKPGFTYSTGKNEFGAHVNFVNFFDGDGSYQISFPVYWKWNF